MTALVAACSGHRAPAGAGGVTEGGAPSIDPAVAAAVRPTAACAFVNRVNIAARAVPSAAAGLRLLAEFAPQFDAQLANAPVAIRGDMGTVFAASRTALARQDLTYLATDPVTAAGGRLAAECG
ncbi:hypothetical protein I6A60_24835 [Frankia sp. AgB1.9]|uniref:hypothetical protein n=1 Tax=unclassified Frankia TaxID=2632575 RepID=UPI001934A3A4|nr:MULTISPECIES: hypothetical protein [unclassified Frankia]MBL7487415.1 hypothetical protein [Frankia sp. AgW1.1]MBL7551067.1 hypothetical protein [Frankia sp. AgB1.9]MBL7618848.1 hypothetical protein [Frankia sp. AgB1.8]